MRIVITLGTPAATTYFVEADSVQGVQQALQDLAIEALQTGEGQFKLSDRVFNAHDFMLRADSLADCPQVTYEDFSSGLQHVYAQPWVESLEAWVERMFQAQAAPLKAVKGAALPKLSIKLPDGDARSAKVWWTEIQADGGVSAYITVDNSAEVAQVQAREAVLDSLVDELRDKLGSVDASLRGLKGVLASKNAG